MTLVLLGKNQPAASLSPRCLHLGHTPRGLFLLTTGFTGLALILWLLLGNMTVPQGLTLLFSFFDHQILQDSGKEKRVWFIEPPNPTRSF